ncbi:MAG: hypothetical protein ACJBCI_02275 [Candidatus Tisiphia sp.]|jgi:hypothetical protein
MLKDCKAVLLQIYVLPSPLGFLIRNGSYEKTVIDDDNLKLTVEVPRDQEGLISILIKNSIISKNFTNNLLVDNKTGV